MATPQSDPADDDDDNDDFDDLPAQPLEIACDTASAARVSWLFSIIIALPVGYGVYSMTRGEMNWSRDWPILGAFVIVFPAVAGFLVLSSIWATLLWRKQGKTVLQIPAGCIIEGETVRGSVVCSRQFELRSAATLRLECLERRTISKGKDGGTRTETRQVWSDEQQIEPDPHGAVTRNVREPGSGTRFRFEIQVPQLRRVPDPRPTARSVVSHSASVHWKLSLEAPVRGLDFQAHFDVPVLKSREFE